MFAPPPASSMSADRTPEQIIGQDRLMQLVFEGYAVVPANRIATLEKSLAERDAQLATAYRIKAECNDTANEERHHRLAAEKALAEAREDTERLNFLDRCNERLNAAYGTNYRWELILNHNVNRLMLGHLEVDLNDAKAHGLNSCRDAIDGAMREIAARRAAALSTSNGGRG
jgi:hypothetical protein